MNNSLFLPLLLKMYKRMNLLQTTSSFLPTNCTKVFSEKLKNNYVWINTWSWISSTLLLISDYRSSMDRSVGLFPSNRFLCRKLTREYSFWQHSSQNHRGTQTPLLLEVSDFKGNRSRSFRKTVTSNHRHRRKILDFQFDLKLAAGSTLYEFTTKKKGNNE